MGKDSSTVSRRDFLKFAGKTAAVSAAFLSGCAQTSMQPAGRSPGGLAHAIDIHHHYIPPELIDEVKHNGQALGVEYFPPKDAKETSSPAPIAACAISPMPASPLQNSTRWRRAPGWRPESCGVDNEGQRHGEKYRYGRPNGPNDKLIKKI